MVDTCGDGRQLLHSVQAHTKSPSRPQQTDPEALRDSPLPLLVSKPNNAAANLALYQADRTLQAVIRQLQLVRLLVAP